MKAPPILSIFLLGYGWVMKFRNIVLLPWIVLLSFFAFTYQNCGSPNTDQSHLKVVFPKPNSKSKLTLKSAVSNRSFAPNQALNIWGGDVQTLSANDLNCFGIAIGGPESSLQGQLCEDTAGSPFRFGVHRMGVLAGESVSLQLDPGANRVIRVLAWKADDNEACRSLLNGQNVKGQSLSKPFLVANQVVNLQAGEQTLNIDASFQNSTELNGCDIFSKDPNQNEQLQSGNRSIGGSVSGLSPEETIELTLGLFSPEEPPQETIPQGVSQRTALQEIVESLSVENGSFQFETLASDGQFYSIGTILPEGKECLFVNENQFGEISGSNINDIAINCIEALRVSGVVTDMLSQTGSVLRLELAIDEGETAVEQISIFADTPFFFGTPSQSGSTYSVRVIQQPLDQICTVTNGSGTFAGQSISNVQVQCIDNSFTISGDSSDLDQFLGAEVELLLSIDQGDGGTETLNITADGTFNFTSILQNGQDYLITINNVFAGELGTPDCNVLNNSGTIGLSNISDVQLECVFGGQ